VKKSKYDWDSISDQDFEELCYDILIKEGFTNLEWVGRSGKDRGRDIKCNKIKHPLTNITSLENYLVQCKKYVARPPTIQEINETLTWADYHKPDVLLFMISHTITSQTRDWLEKISKDKFYEIIRYEEKYFDTFFRNNEDVYNDYFLNKKTYLDREDILIKKDIL